MADDIPQDQTQTTETTSPTVPPTDQPPVETSPVQPTSEQSSTNTVSSETLNIPNPEPVAPATPEPQTQPAEAKTETPAQIETQPPVSPPVFDIPALHFPFSGNFPVTFSCGQQSDNEEIKKKFQEWGIVGHNGLDFGLTSGTEVYPCDSGKVVQSGDNGDFGTSITIQHSWGQSIYGHLQETRVKEGDEIQVNNVIGLSGSSGAAFGDHLHFAIKPNNPDLNNGYLGFIDPAPYLSLPSQKEETTETPPIQTPPVEEQMPLEEIKPPEPVIHQEEPTINIEPEKPAEQSQIPQPSNEEIQKQVDEKLKTELDARRLKANQARQTKREENLMKIEKLIEEKKLINNDDVRELLHVSQSTATNYLEDLVKRGTIKLNGKGKATIYSY
ncbi:MAG: peptidoglycan DD-metalloendopeptidase family protein [Patescibacteria group bacterium]|nr:peptidoglycan DD-metalloendopeptidase family protein [Patescibacteria group bacterium]